MSRVEDKDLRNSRIFLKKVVQNKDKLDKLFLRGGSAEKAKESDTSKNEENDDEEDEIKEVEEEEVPFTKSPLYPLLKKPPAQRNDNDVRHLRQIMAKFDFWKDCDYNFLQSDLSELAKSAELREIPPLTQVFKMSEEANSCYFVI